MEQLTEKQIRSAKIKYTVLSIFSHILETVGVLGLIAWFSTMGVALGFGIAALRHLDNMTLIRAACILSIVHTVSFCTMSACLGPTDLINTTLDSLKMKKELGKK